MTKTPSILFRDLFVRTFRLEEDDGAFDYMFRSRVLRDNKARSAGAGTSASASTSFADVDLEKTNIHFQAREALCRAKWTYRQYQVGTS